VHLYHIQNEQTQEILKKSDTFYEEDIENLVQRNPGLLFNQKLLLIGRQIITSTRKRIDLLGVDQMGRLIVIELKRGIAPRDMMAQILDYSSWLSKISERELEQIAKSYFQKYDLPYHTLHQAYQEFYKVKTIPRLGSDIVNVLFAENFQEDLINAVDYLKDQGVDIYLLEFSLFEKEEGEYIIVENLSIDENQDIEEPMKNDSKSFSNVTDRKNNRLVFTGIKKMFEQEFENWANQFDAEWSGFIIYQPRNGNWISIRSQWLVATGEVVLLFGLDIRNQSFVSWISYPKQYDGGKILELKRFLDEQQYGDEIERTKKGKYLIKHTRIAKILYTVESTDEFYLDDSKANSLVENEMPALMKAIEILLPKK